jgi:hypothetical protein
MDKVSQNFMSFPATVDRCTIHTNVAIAWRQQVGADAQCDQDGNNSADDQ